MLESSDTWLRRNAQPPDIPASYGIVGGNAMFYRRVSDGEYENWKSSGELSPEPGGMDFGKHVTTTADLARAWGVRLVEWRHEATIGRVLQICLGADLAEDVDFVGPNTDGIGACYFVLFEQLTRAAITEV